jgi:spermidine/putrescine transport system substrate-binding protein
MKRRTFLRNSLGSVVLGGATSCHSKTNQRLRVLTWTDYFDPSRLTMFSSVYNCTVDLVNFSSNEELYARLLAGERADVLVPSSYMRHILATKGMLAKFDSEDARVESMPYLRGISGLSWIDDHHPEGPCSWSWIGKSTSGRITLLDDMRETIGAALKSLGYSGNSNTESEIRSAVALVQEWKQRLAGFESEYYKLGLVAGEYDMAHAYSGDIFQTYRKNPSLRFAVPSEGAMTFTDELCIEARTEQQELAAEFIRFNITADSIAAHAAHTGYQMVKPDEVITTPQGIDPIDANAFRNSEEILALGESQSLWEYLWREIRKN